MQVKRKKIRLDLSVWVVVSATAVLAAILSMMIFIQFQQREIQAQTVFVEKGTTLIRSFEAGLRDHVDCAKDIFSFRKLLMETAQQPDIDYIIVTDNKGNILADSDPSMLDLQYGKDLDTKKIAQSREISWRQTANPGGAGTFEVYRGLFPWRQDTAAGDQRPLIIFVGFNMYKIEKASREDTYRTIIIAVVMILIGSLAIVSLLLVQDYRLARTSLSRVRVFSEALVRNMPIGLLAVDKNNRIVACNEHARDLFAGDFSDVLGQDAARVLPDELVRLLNKLDASSDQIEGDISLSSAKKEEQTWEVVAAVFADEDVPGGKILLARNVTALRGMEKEVARSRHLNAIGSLAAGVAHEIRNPLSSIKGFAVYLKQKLSGNMDDEHTADIMIAETERLNRVISQLIEFARPLKLKKEKTDFPALVKQTLKLVEAEAQKNNVQVDVRSPDYLPEVEVDADKIKQVLLNIFLNALAAMTDGGHLSVELLQTQNTLEVVVSDTGTGIDEKDLPLIYDPYFTSKPYGTGLGLAVAQKIMEAHSAFLQIESRAGTGTKVILRFDLNRELKSEK
ncbi:MAG: PAS domain-containing protein [Syntrophaceae bacterium]|nr:PAS domain-containing protein [Syntrophaceae bacterium]